LTIAANAPVGRRMVRVRNDRSGLTNFRYFVVGRLPEQVEKESKQSPPEPTSVPLPVVINGRIDPPLDQDEFQFEARRGQQIVAAVTAHRLDSMGTGRVNTGFVDAGLELLDSAGRVVADAEDSLGLDPLVHFAVPADGFYTAACS
jgi:hypothetical protein